MRSLVEVGLRAGWRMETLDLLARCFGGVSTGDVIGSLGAPPPPPEFRTPPPGTAMCIAT